MMKKSFFFYALGFILIQHTIGFVFLDNPNAYPSNNPHIGNTLYLTSTSSSPHETCIWKHNGRTCQFDWNRLPDRPSSERCNGYGNRLQFRGVYEAQECVIEIEKVENSDTGKWTCEMVDKRGKRVTRDIWIEVIETSQHSKKRSNSSSESHKNTTGPSTSTIETSTKLVSSNINQTIVMNIGATKSGKYNLYH